MAASGYAGHLTPTNRGFSTLSKDECIMTRRESPKRYPKCPDPSILMERSAIMKDRK